MNVYQRVQCEAPKIAKLVHITPITMVYGTYNELVTGANLNQHSHHWGAPHCSRWDHNHHWENQVYEPVAVPGALRSRPNFQSWPLIAAPKATGLNGKCRTCRVHSFCCWIFAAWRYPTKIISQRNCAMAWWQRNYLFKNNKIYIISYIYYISYVLNINLIYLRCIIYKSYISYIL